jgi:hypothetical protein
MTDIEREQIIRRLAGGNPDDEDALRAEDVVIEGHDISNTADRCFGCADWIGYIPSPGRAVWVSNGNPIWFDADSLDHAVELVKSGEDLSYLN